MILSILNQIGWKSKIQSVVTESDLESWYDRAMRGKFAPTIGQKVLRYLTEEIVVEFPASDNASVYDFISGRGYLNLKDQTWD